MSQSKYPDSVQHMKDAWRGFPPSEFREAIPEQAPKLLTLDRPGAKARRDYNLRPPVPKTKKCSGFSTSPTTGVRKRDEVDEWPPAVTLESADPINKNRQAHLRCIPAWDNGGSGSSFGFEINNYQPRTFSSTKYKIPDAGVVEFVVTP